MLADPAYQQKMVVQIARALAYISAIMWHDKTAKGVVL
jgi:hypothetical protein